MFLYDKGGVEVSWFYVEIFGNVIFYFFGGRLMFYGGIIGVCGYEGDNKGWIVVELIINI